MQKKVFLKSKPITLTKNRNIHDYEQFYIKAFIHYQKVIMALAGLFLISFLLVHLGINITVLIPDTNREIFNKAAHFMSTNPVIKIFEVVLFAGFIIHIIYGIVLQMQNWKARPKGYKVTSYSELSYFSKFMIHTGILVFDLSGDPHD